MARMKAKVTQHMIARALRAARDADLAIASFSVVEETGELRIFTDLASANQSTLSAATEPSADIDAAVEAWR